MVCRCAFYASVRGAQTQYNNEYNEHRTSTNIDITIERLPADFLRRHATLSPRHFDVIRHAAPAAFADFFAYAIISLRAIAAAACRCRC